MDWGALPLEPLERIFRQLKFRDRLVACSLVCQHWNRALFACPTLARGVVLGISGCQSVKVREALRASQRNYRQLSIVLNGGDREDHDNEGVSKFLTEVASLWSVQSVSVVGEPPTLLECFQLNSALFGGITELSLELTKNIDWAPFGRQEIRMGELRKLHYLQMYLGRERVGTAFRLIVPKLESVAIVLDSMANEEALYWEDPLIDLEQCDKLRSLEVDLNTTMWEEFFDVERKHVERVLIRRASDEFQERDWDRIFQKMPNLRKVEMTFSSDSMLASLKRNCNKLEKIVLNGFCYHDGSFASNISWSTLKKLFIDGWFNGGVYSRDPSLNLHALENLNWKYVELTPAQDYLTLITPQLRKLILRGCDYKRFHLEVGPHLDLVDIDYYGPQQFAPNFFSSLHAVTKLTLHINGDSMRLVQHLTYTMQLRRLEIICGTEHRGYDISDLFSVFARNCPILEKLTVRNEHENQLALDYAALTLLEGLNRLRLLTFQYITLTNVTGAAIRMERLDRLDISGCRVLDLHGMLAGHFPIEGDALTPTEDMEWTVSSAL